LTASLPSRPETDADLASVITSGADCLGVDLDGEQTGYLVAYLRLIERWNATYNLTAVRSVRAMATQHVVDSLSAIASVRAHLPDDNRRILDVGSGAGLPGVVIAIVDREAHVTCVDSVGKKTAFVKHVAMTLGLDNLSAVHTRVESMRAPPAFGLVVSRAFASISDFVSSTQHLLGPGGWWIAMKGKVPLGEISDAASSGLVFEVEPISVPGLEAERCLLVAQTHLR
jgi:16S rRNA (guanine527-N7)-methyltransferase